MHDKISSSHPINHVLYLLLNEVLFHFKTENNEKHLLKFTQFYFAFLKAFKGTIKFSEVNAFLLLLTENSKAYSSDILDETLLFLSLLNQKIFSLDELSALPTFEILLTKQEFWHLIVKSKLLNKKNIAYFSSMLNLTLFPQELSFKR